MTYVINWFEINKIQKIIIIINSRRMILYFCLLFKRTAEKSVR